MGLRVEIQKCQSYYADRLWKIRYPENRMAGFEPMLWLTDKQLFVLVPRSQLNANASVFVERMVQAGVCVAERNGQAVAQLKDVDFWSDEALGKLVEDRKGWDEVGRRAAETLYKYLTAAEKVWAEILDGSSGRG